MFESMESGTKLPKHDYQRRLPGLRAELVEAQLALTESDFSVIIIVSGVDGAGKGQAVHRLNEWLDPRGIETHAFWETSDEESERPFYWRFWRVLPPRARIAIFFGSWYTQAIISRAFGISTDRDLEFEAEQIISFEKMLVDDGALIVKLWFHLSKQAQRKRLKKLEQDPRVRGHLTPTDWEHHKRYDTFADISGRVIGITDTEQASWRLIDAGNRRYREMKMGEIVLESLKERLARSKSTSDHRHHRRSTPETKSVDRRILKEVDLTQHLSADSYRRQLAQYQGKLGGLAWEAYHKKISTVAVFEGWDAAGKGSGIHRVTEAMDPRLCRVIQVAAPSDEERSHHYLWRFWRYLPRGGRVTIFDRSWYGRVLVERVEGFAAPSEWMRAYTEINEFERQLIEHGVIVLKFWMHISKEEQLRRFQRRQTTPHKQYKITDEDWRNREKWDAYEEAIIEMVNRTSTKSAPWTLVAGNDKRFARIQILKTFADALAKVV